MKSIKSEAALQKQIDIRLIEVETDLETVGDLIIVARNRQARLGLRKLEVILEAWATILEG